MKRLTAKSGILISAIMLIFSTVAAEMIFDKMVYDKTIAKTPPAVLARSAKAKRNINKHNMTSVVFGYLPEWKYLSARENIRYELLTHLAVFDFTSDQFGNITNPALWPWNDVISAAHKQNVKVIMTLADTDSLRIHQIMTDSRAKINIFNNISNIMSEFDLDGVNIDFENLKKNDRSGVISAFMHELTSYLHEVIPNSEVSFAGPPVNWGGWNFKSIADACDYIFVMGYDYIDARSTVSGPSGSLDGTIYSVESTLNNSVFGYGEVTRSNPRKLILGVPYYGHHWITKTAQPFSRNLKYVETATFNYAILESLKYKRIWDAATQTPWLCYRKNGQWHQLWYEDSKSIGLKYDLAIEKKLRGVGIWALGFDNGREELWNEIRKKFYVPSLIELTTVPLRKEELNDYYFQTSALKVLQKRKMADG